MSWAEVKKVNSDMNEPLNYTNYIYDISNALADSYVLDPNNHEIWEDLILNSTYLFGHTKIHDTVLERLTEIEIDSMWDKSSKLGRQLNNFHSNEAYSLGDAKAILNGMTLESYNNMIEKFRDGYCRFVNKHLGDDQACAWIKEIFGIDLSPCTTVESLLADEEKWGEVLKSEPLMVALTSSQDFIEKLASSDVAVQRMGEAIQYIGQNGEAIEVIANKPELVELIANDKTSMDFIVQEDDAIIVILSHSEFAEACLSSEVAMTSFASAESAIALVCQFYVNMNQSKTSISGVKSHTTAIPPLLEKIWQGDTALEGLNELSQQETDMIAVIDKIMGNATMIDTYVKQIAENETFAAQIAQSAEIMTVIVNDVTMSKTLATSGILFDTVLASLDTAWPIVVSSSIAMTEIVAVSGSMTKVIASSGAMDILANSETARGVVYASSLAISIITTSSMAVAKLSAGQVSQDPSIFADITTLCKNSTAWNLVIADETAINVVAQSTVAMDEIGAYNTACIAISGNDTALAACNQQSMSRAKLLAGIVSLTVASFPDMKTLGNDSSAMSKIAGNSTAMKSLLKMTNCSLDLRDLSTAMTALTNSSTAYNLFLDDKNAMANFWISSTAREAFKANTNFLSAASSKQVAMDTLADSSVTYCKDMFSNTSFIGYMISNCTVSLKKISESNKTNIMQAFWDACTWANINTLAGKVTADTSSMFKKWSTFGVTKDVTLNGSYPGTLRLVSCYHKIASSDSYHSFVFMSDRSAYTSSSTIYSSDTTFRNYGNWTYNSNSYYSWLPSEVTSYIDTNIVVDYFSSPSLNTSSQFAYTTSISTLTSQRAFTPSSYELGQNYCKIKKTNDAGGENWSLGTETFDYFKSNTGRYVYQLVTNTSKTPVSYWLRDLYTPLFSGTSVSKHRYCYCTNSGNFSYASQSTSFYLPLCFCIT